MTFYLILDKIIKIGCGVMKIHKKHMILRCVTTIITLSIICFIFYQSIKPADKSSSDSSKVLNILNYLASLIGLDNPFSHYVVRKLAHFVEFAVLGVSFSFMYNSYMKNNKIIFFFSITSSALIAVCDECIQLLSDGRACQFKDMCIDTAGALCGCVFVVLVLFVIRSLKYKKLNGFRRGKK